MHKISEALALSFKPKALKAGECMVRGGQTSKHLAWVETGLLRSYQINFKGEDVTTNFFTPLTFCGSWHSFYHQAPSFENIVSITPASLQLIHFDRLHELFEQSLEINFLGRKTIEQVCISKDIRISKMLKLDAQDRYLWFFEHYSEVVKTAPLKYIASYLGMTPETLSRIRRMIIS